MKIEDLLDNLDGAGLVLTDMDLIEQALENMGLGLDTEIGEGCPDCGHGVLRPMTAAEQEDAKFDNAVAGVNTKPNKVCQNCGYQK